MAEDYIDFNPVLTSYYTICAAHKIFDCRESACEEISDKRAEWYHRWMNLKVRRGMTERAARIVVDAAMYGIGCLEGTVRAEIEAQKEKPTD